MNNIVKIQSISKTEYDITFKCPFCGELTTIAVPKVEYIDWESGQYHVQDCFRSLGPDERELFVTGLCMECQKEAFKEFEDLEY